MEEKEYIVEIPIAGTRIITVKGTSKTNALERALNQTSEVIDEFDSIIVKSDEKEKIIVSEYNQEYFDEKYGELDCEY